MTDMMTIPPMPDTRCPAWCTLDHAARWAQHVEIQTTYWEIPHSDGTTGVHEPVTDPAEILASWERLEGSDLYHSCEIGEGAEGDLNRWSVALTQVAEEAGPSLYLSLDGSVTADEARVIAAQLLRAAEKLEQVLAA